AFAGRSGELVLETNSGPAGDGTGDWVGWARPRVVAQAAAIEEAQSSMLARDLIVELASAEKSPPGTEPSVRELDVERAGRKEHTITTLAGGFEKFPIQI